MSRQLSPSELWAHKNRSDKLAFHYQGVKSAGAGPLD